MFCVYGLSDPRTNAIRYVGVTKCGLKVRYDDHIRVARHGKRGVPDRTHRSFWIRSLLAVGLRPSLIPLEDTEDRSREQWWIRHLRSLGSDLVNATNGGEGSGYQLTPEHVSKIVATKTGMKYRPMDPEKRKNMARSGRTVSQSTRDKIRAALKGRPVPDDRRKKISEAVRSALARKKS